MQCYTELLPPSGVTHALSVPFISAGSSNLVVAKTSLLQIFSVIDVISGENGKPEDKARRLDRPQNGKLVLVAEYALSGTVTDMSRVKILNSKSGGEAILIAFRNAKLSLIEWDPERHAISTISIHYYEKEDLTRSPWVPDLSSCGSHLTVDPTSRCAILNFGIRNLAIIPFHQPGDDLVMDDYDPSLDGEHDATETSETANKEQQSYQTPYGSSFVLPLTALEPSLLHPISLAFLYEYREPTFGILYSQVATSNALLHERKDVVFYAVFTLDLEQRASTTLLSVARLPSDLFKVVALPSPVGGALLIGTNELVHVDQAGKTNAVGVNEFSRQVSAFSMADQSDLALRLEGCHVEQLDMEKGDLILVLSTGDMILVSFKLDGRSVSGLSVRPISANGGGNILEAPPSCSATLSHNRIFFGSEDADSVLLGWSDTSAAKSRGHKRQGADDAGGTSDLDEDEDDYNYEDDLYSTAPSGSLQDATSGQDSSLTGSYNFRLHDRLPNLGPLRDIALGKSQKSHRANSDNDSSTSAELELVASHGSGRSSGLVVLKRELDPHVINSLELDHLDCLWSVTVNDHATAPNNEDARTENEVSRYVILSKIESSDKEESLVYALAGSKLEPFKAPEFNPNEDYTIDIGTLANGTRVVQVLKSEVRSYDANLGLAQIYPVWDEDTSDERVVVAASFSDPYLVILRDDATLLILQADASGDLDEVTLPEEINEARWLSCSLYRDTQSFFSSSASAENAGSFLLYALNSDCKLFIFQLPDLQSVSVIECVDSLLPILSKDAPLRRSSNRETLTEICVADLGDQWNKSPYLIVRTGTDELVIYRPFMATDDNAATPRDLHFLKESNHALPRFPYEAAAKSTANAQLRPRPLRSLPDVSGFSVVFMPGASPSFIFKAAATTPHVVRLRADHVPGLSSLHVPDSEAGFVYLDSDNTVRLCQLPRDIQFYFPWTMRKIRVGEEIDHLAYSSSSETYILGTSYKADFKLPDDDEVHTEWRNEVISFLPQVDQSSVKIISPKTWSIIDSHYFAPAERVMAVKNINLEVSEHTHERRDLIVVGTAFARGEDIASRGCIYVFDVIEVVPDPERPQANRRLKLVGKEPVKGAVTALSGIGGQGFLIVAQGQKCMVRGLKEDGSLLPVAFMDMQCYVNVVKELKGTGLCILGDALKGLWFTGYSEDPYKMTLFGKDTAYLEVVAADFLPDGNKLYILVADSECNLHVLQYDPEDPKSSNGDRLLDRSTFHMGHFASTMTLLPRTVVSSELVVSNSDEMDIDLYIPRHQVLITTQTGLIGLVTPVSEESYRRLSALQSQLINTLEHPCGLNHRAYRAIESDGIGGRGMIDGTLLQRWLDLGRQRKTEIAARVGADEWEIKADLEAVSGAGLGYL